MIISSSSSPNNHDHLNDHLRIIMIILIMIISFPSSRLIHHSSLSGIGDLVVLEPETLLVEGGVEADHDIPARRGDSKRPAGR
jgi:hypothetical protein